MTESKNPSLSAMSKKRYNEIAKMLKELVNDEQVACDALNRLCTIMKYDPNEKKYTKEMGQRTNLWRHRKASELGVSTYELGQRKHYEHSKSTKVV